MKGEQYVEDAGLLLHAPTDPICAADKPTPEVLDPESVDPLVNTDPYANYRHPDGTLVLGYIGLARRSARHRAGDKP